MHLFRQFVVKVHSRCNLACNHCYVYEAVDQSWRDQPRAMTPETATAVSGVLASYAQRHELDQVEVVLHGGEPLLIGLDRMRDLIAQFKATVGAVTALTLTVQTNGVRLDERWADLFLEHNVRVGVSIDGGREANDRHRLYRNGASSYDAVVRAITLLASERYRPIFAGLLCTVDVENDAISVFRDLAALRPPRIDLLLPHATWEEPPPQAVAGQTPYGDWLSQIYDAWYDAPPEVGIRVFEELLNAMLGGVSRSEAIGESAPESLVIETDGSLEQTDALKVAFAGAAATGYTITGDTVAAADALDALASDPRAFGSAIPSRELSPQCQACPIVGVCGGGLYPHRYRSDTLFANPSVYCQDLQQVIGHIGRRLQQDLASHPAIQVPDAAPIAVLDFTDGSASRLPAVHGAGIN